MSKNKYATSNTSTSATPARRVKINGYSHAKADARKATRRDEAEARADAQARLTPAARLAKVNGRRGSSAREWERLTGDIIHRDPATRAQFNLKSK
jgi:Spy/CpxP family protein refolding chaperone